MTRLVLVHPGVITAIFGVIIILALLTPSQLPAAVVPTAMELGLMELWALGLYRMGNRYAYPSEPRRQKPPLLFWITVAMSVIALIVQFTARLAEGDSLAGQNDWIAALALLPLAAWLWVAARAGTKLLAKPSAGMTFAFAASLFFLPVGAWFIRGQIDNPAASPAG